jgi:hypothetical protein
MSPRNSVPEHSSDAAAYRRLTDIDEEVIAAVNRSVRLQGDGRWRSSGTEQPNYVRAAHPQRGLAWVR